MRLKLLWLIVLLIAPAGIAQAQPATTRIILHSGTGGAANGERPFGTSWNGGTITVSGTFTGLNAVAEISPDGTTFNTVTVTNLNGLTQANTITTAGVYFMPIGRAYQFGVRVTAVTGTVNIVVTPTEQVLARYAGEGGGGSGAPTDATYITQTPNSSLSAEQALSSLATGLLKNTTTTGVLSIAGASDLPSAIDAAKIADGSVSNAEYQRLDGVTSGIQSQIDGKQASLGFTAENVANKDTDGTLAANSDTKYASQKATKTYADTKEVPLTFSSPLVRTTNTVACATCVIASSPGAGIAHFAGSTQTVTSSPIVNADIATGTIDLTAKVTGLLRAANIGVNVLDQSAYYAADAGSNDTYVITLSPVPAGYVTGGHYRFKANTANTGAATININSLGAKTIKKAAGGITTDLADNDILSGQFVDLVYDGANMQMQSLLGNAPSGGGITIGTTTITGGTDTKSLYNNAGVVGERTVTGTGNAVLSASPTFTGTITASRANFTSVSGIASLSNNIAVSTGFSSGIGLVTPSDGVLTITNWGSSDLGRIQLGGTTSSFGGIARDGAGIRVVTANSNTAYSFIGASQYNIDATLTGSGTTGNVTINKAAGSARIAATGTTVTVTSSFATANSIIFVSPSTNDATCRFANYTTTSGSFTINTTAACTAETEFRFAFLN